MSEVIAVDVGGTSIKSGVVDRAGRLSREHRAETPPTGADGAAVLDAVVGVVEKLRGPHPPAAVGVVVPGVVDENAGVAVMSENLAWHDVPVGAVLAERLGCPVAVGHDVRAGGLAEQRVGACRGVANAAFVPVGTGIAAALVVDGVLCRGDGYAGEVGHIDVGHDLPCACGGQGCLEAIASAAAVTRRYAQRTGAGVSGSRDVADRVRLGDAVAVEVWDEALDALARGLASLVGLVAPEVIAIGGGLGESGELVIEPLERRLRSRLTFHRVPRLVPAQLGDGAGCVGAGLLARDLAGER
ncbi:glucokinase [Haloactinopolyspora alba]|uniref:Glucokinase n=1 Tax=Haloactinopolyspora alba TaxID=648780 RepID=A0A2P8DM45_9ACTN|nr:ROK family protein [Haloactinopolyspora alba]PSK98271.1 glucokinase [Haloactinopolyspora alba]